MILVILDIISFLCEGDFSWGVNRSIYFVSRTSEKASMGIADVRGCIDVRDCVDY